MIRAILSGIGFGVGLAVGRALVTWALRAATAGGLLWVLGT